jgi:hypothetical protein
MRSVLFMRQIYYKLFCNVVIHGLDIIDLMQIPVEGDGDGLETEAESAVLEDVFFSPFQTGYGGGHLFDQTDAVGLSVPCSLADHIIVDDVSLEISLACEPEILEGAV